MHRLTSATIDNEADLRTLLGDGNRIADSLRNMLQNPQVALLFVLPGLGDSFRVNGRATIITDQALLAPSAIEGKSPKLGIVVDIEQYYTQCPKAFIRSHLWEPERFVEQSAIPTSGEVLHAIHGESFDGDDYDAQGAVRYAKREGFY